ncbi:MAG: efflux RND transporter permease subunit, partial [Rhodospirillaceae bacterium]|nr:efflux RND transporter permease subunit [Rhodospirillaceae bacterium]
YGDFIENVVQDRIERVPGIAGLNVYGGMKREMRVVVDPERMARFGLTVPAVINAIRAANSSASAGNVDEGKRRYVVRTEGELSSIEQVSNVVVRSISDSATGQISRVTVGDIGKIVYGYREPTSRIRRLGEQTLIMNAVGDAGKNVIVTMAGVHKALEDLNSGPLKTEGLELIQMYDETIYINSAINLVQQNIWLGGFLAAIVLLLFLRSGAATIIISVAIPVSVIGAFVAMAAMGRSINVISLAGIAFAVGMVVDAAIVVLENIYRLRQEGREAGDASYNGAKQVWSAVLVSALTTVLVFAPILAMNLEVGQLFRDIAVAISVAVVLSLLVAVTVIPALSNRLLQKMPKNEGVNEKETAITKYLQALDAWAAKFTATIVSFTHRVSRDKKLALRVVVGITVSAAIVTWALLPKLEYLPEGNRNLVIGAILPPPGYNLQTTISIAEEVEAEVKKYWASETGPDEADDGTPKIDNFFFVARPTSTFVGASAIESDRAGELIPIIRKPVFKEPGTFGFVTQPSLFGRSVGSGRSIDIDISGPNLEEVLGVAINVTQATGKALPREKGNQLRPKPGLELGAPEVRIIPDPIRLSDNGITAREFSQTVDAFNDGLRVAQITVGGERIDLTLAGPESGITETQGVSNLPVVTKTGAILPVGSLADVVVTSGPTEIRHIERERTVTIEVRPAPDVSMESAIDTINANVIGPMISDGLPHGMSINLSGTADKLSQAWDAMVLDLLIAIVIVYLVMAVLFESFVYPLIIILSVPLATAGGVIGLGLLGLFAQQSLDMLTMLGFIILVGIVVNNAILIVHQTLYHQRTDGMNVEDSIVAATQNRIRPIFMSTLTSIFGMLPLVLFPGAGSELYRGLGSVVVGGLTLSALLTLFIIPPLLALVSKYTQPAAKS